nr:Chain A, DNA-directed RNA polymerase subunit beta domain 1 [Thermus aquaticus]
PLTEIQVESYKKALQADVPPEKRENVGIQAAFKETFPIEEGDKGKGGLVLDFLEYRIGDPPFSQDECREKDLTYQAPLYARLQLIHKDTGLIKEDEVFLGHLPLMTEDGSFIINGADRVIVSQGGRTVGELMADQFRVGLARLARGVRERMVMGSPDTLTPAKLVNSRPLEAALREFFSRSQLS